jgi:hypothetical protein
MAQEDAAAQPAAEPLGTIHTPVWAATRTRVPGIASARLRVIFAGVLDSVEEGWIILRPLVVAAEAFIYERTPCWPAASHVANVAWTGVGELYGSMALKCAAAIPETGDAPRKLGFAGVSSEAREIQSTLHVLRMASADPYFPPLIRDQIGDVTTAFDSWLGRFEEVLQPAIEVEEAVFVGTRRPPIVHTRLRILD